MPVTDVVALFVIEIVWDRGVDQPEMAVKEMV
jgi:hypothetical protein